MLCDVNKSSSQTNGGLTNGLGRTKIRPLATVYESIMKFPKLEKAGLLFDRTNKLVTPLLCRYNKKDRNEMIKVLKIGGKG